VRAFGGTIRRVTYPASPSRAAARLSAAVLLASLVAASASAEDVVGVRDDNALVSFDSATPGTVRSVRPVTGLAEGEILYAIAFRPSDGVLFGIGSTNQVYRIDRDTGVAVDASAFAFQPLLQGSDFGLTFDLTGSLMRLTSDSGQNLSLDSVTGATSSEGAAFVYDVGDPLAGQTAGLGACTWKLAPTGSTFYAIDTARRLLVRTDTPSAGAVATVGPLGTTALELGGYTGLDVSPDTGQAFAALSLVGEGVSRFYAVNLATGAATSLGSVGSLLRDMAVAPAAPPAPPGTRLLGLVAPAEIVSFTTDRPYQLVRNVHVRGLPIGDALVAIAVRPANGIAYGLTRTGLYDLDLSGGTAELVGSGLGVTLPAGQIGCDFDPATDRLRVVAGADVNLAIDPYTGAVASDDASLAFAPGDVREGAAADVHAVAFTGRAAPLTTSTCYALESSAALLARLGDPAHAPGESRDGALYTLGPASIDGVSVLPPVQAMTTTGKSTGYAVLQTSSAASSLFLVNLKSGRATPVGTVAAPGLVRGLTVEPLADPARLYVTKAKFEFDYRRADRDKVVLKGSAPYAIGSAAGKTVQVEIGGLTKTFALDDKGKGVDGDDTLKIGGKAPRGILLKLTWKREALAAALADEGMDGSTYQYRSARQVVVKLRIDNRTYRATVDVAYTANPGKAGKAAAAK
jgi:hypothetical protein